MIREVMKAGWRVVQAGKDTLVVGPDCVISENLISTLSRSRQALRWSC